MPTHEDEHIQDDQKEEQAYVDSHAKNARHLLNSFTVDIFVN